MEDVAVLSRSRPLYDNGILSKSRYYVTLLDHKLDMPGISKIETPYIIAYYGIGPDQLYQVWLGQRPYALY